LGIPAVILFGIPEHKDEVGSDAYRRTGNYPNGYPGDQKEVRELVVITDVCLCEYTSTGHCGIIRDGQIINDESIELLAKEALTHVQAGADMVAPSDMFDGRVRAIRQILDKNNFHNIPIMSYAAKYASGFYGRSATRPKARPNSETGVRTRWTRPIPTKPFVR